MKRVEAVPASNELLALQRGELDVASHGVGGGKTAFPIADAVDRENLEAHPAGYGHGSG